MWLLWFSLILKSGFSSPLGIQAPLNDLILYKKLINYTTVDKKISAVAVNAFSKHLWYLTVPNNVKNKMAEHLRTFIPTYLFYLRNKSQGLNIIQRNKKMPTYVKPKNDSVVLYIIAF